MATYNGSCFVAAQLHSLLESIGGDDEIVVSDDASSDGTRQVVESVPDPRIRLLPSGPRLGYQANFARAIASARGRFVFFSDQDDICLPQRIETSLAALQQRSCVCGDAVVVDAGLRTTAPSYFSLRRATRFTATQLFLRPAIIGATMACRQDFLLDALPFPPGIPHDHWLSVLAAGQGQLTVVPAPFILHRRHAGVASLTGLQRRRPLWRILSERARLLWALLAWRMRLRAAATPAEGNRR